MYFAIREQPVSGLSFAVTANPTDLPLGPFSSRDPHYHRALQRAHDLLRSLSDHEHRSRPLPPGVPA